MNISIENLHNNIKLIFVEAGCKEKDAEIVADVLLAAEKRGIPSHGLVRIKDYLGLWAKKRLNLCPTPRIIHDTPVSATIDGDNGLGMLVAHYAMNLAIEKAKTSYTAWIAVRNSNHYGIAAYYSMMALEHEMIGISMTNANPLVAPTFSIDKMLGTNPLAVAIPSGKEEPFIADFATTPIARGKLEMYEKMNKKVSLGLIQDKFGNSVDDPSILKDGGAILPLGGDYEHGSHKGYCMSALVDIFSAVLSGAGFGPFVPPQVSYLEPKANAPGIGLGHFFGAMRIDSFQPKDEFKDYMDLWIKTFKQSKSMSDESKVLIPGEPERIKEALALKNGIELNEKVVEELNKTLKELNIKNPF